MNYDISSDGAVSSITWRQPVTEMQERDDLENTLTLSFANAGGGSWIVLSAEKFAFDSADEILNLAVLAERLRAEHEKAGVFG